MVLDFAKPDRICIVDRNGMIVRLNDRNRTELRFDVSERVRARRVLNRLNTYQPKSEIGPFRLLPLIGEPATGQVRE